MHPIEQMIRRSPFELHHNHEEYLNDEARDQWRANIKRAKTVTPAKFQLFK